MRAIIFQSIIKKKYQYLEHSRTASFCLAKMNLEKSYTVRTKLSVEYQSKRWWGRWGIARNELCLWLNGIQYSWKIVYKSFETVKKKKKDNVHRITTTKVQKTKQMELLIDCKGTLLVMRSYLAKTLLKKSSNSWFYPISLFNEQELRVCNFHSDQKSLVQLIILAYSRNACRKEKISSLRSRVMSYILRPWWAPNSQLWISKQYAWNVQPLVL